MNPSEVQPAPSISLFEGFPDSDRDEIAGMYWSAFGAKLSLALSPAERAIELLARALNPSSSIVARANDGRLLGVAGYKTATGSFAAIDFDCLRRQFGVAGAVWRGTILSFLERRPQAGILLMDGIFVAESARGQGVGTVLLNAVKRKAGELGCSQVRLDVIDTNPGAQRLYEREGFRAVAVRSLGPLRHLFGFRRATTMVADSGPAS